MKKYYAFFVLSLIFITFTSFSQFKNYKVKGGAYYNMISPSGEFVKDLSSFYIRGFFAVELGKYFDVELGGGFLKWKQKDQYNGDKEGQVEADLIPIDVRIRFEPIGWHAKYLNPYFYVGGGVARHELKKAPVFSTYSHPYDSSELDGWVGIFPMGGGLEIRLAKQLLLDLTAGATFTLTDKINANKIGDPNDGWFNYGIGLVVTGKSGRDDTDKDGLYDDEEEEKYLTDPENPDTDADGLKDGEEVKTYHSDPKNPDSDGDALKDGEEVKTYLTNPTNPDTDGDGLKDGSEVSTYKTNPLVGDTDSDGLLDGAEVNTHKTDPLKLDTDGDTLGDGDEVNTYTTNPLNMDTDGGTVDDGTEVRRGTNPLIASDDIVREEIKIGQVMILEGINFETGSSNISGGSEEILMKAYTTMKNNPTIEVEISGHTDSRGSNSSNQRLSEARANSVKAWLVEKGIDGNRITTVGMGEDMPLVPNDSPENMTKNRRIEFKRTK
jgi:outer membrane protein OmpA-like peptidoglycan-associated protein